MEAIDYARAYEAYIETVGDVPAGWWDTVPERFKGIVDRYIEQRYWWPKEVADVRIRVSPKRDLQA